MQFVMVNLLKGQKFRSDLSGVCLYTHRQNSLNKRRIFLFLSILLSVLFMSTNIVKCHNNNSI